MSVTAPTELVRPMVRSDIDQVLKIARHAYVEPVNQTEYDGLDPWADSARQAVEGDRIAPRDMARHILRTDPALCLVLEEDGKIRGAVMAVDREGLVVMSMVAVRPKHQGRGYAEAMLAHIRTVLDSHSRAMAVARATESIELLFPWNFDIHPAMRAAGPIDRSKLPAVHSVRDGDESDLDFITALDRRLRGAARGPDHELFLANARLHVVKDKKGKGTGYAYAYPNGSPVTLVATSTTAARELLVTCLAGSSSGDVPLISNITGEQRWAFDVARRLGMVLHLAGPVIVRGMALPTPYLAHDALG